MLTSQAFVSLEASAGTVNAHPIAVAALRAGRGRAVVSIPSFKTGTKGFTKRLALGRWEREAAAFVAAVFGAKRHFT